MASLEPGYASMPRCHDGGASRQARRPAWHNGHFARPGSPPFSLCVLLASGSSAVVSRSRVAAGEWSWLAGWRRGRAMVVAEVPQRARVAWRPRPAGRYAEDFCFYEEFSSNTTYKSSWKQKSSKHGTRQPRGPLGFRRPGRARHHGRHDCRRCRAVAPSLARQPSPQGASDATGNLVTPRVSGIALWPQQCGKCERFATTAIA